MGVKAVLIKGGHSLAESQKQVDGEIEDCNDNSIDSAGVKTTLGYAQDYFLSSEGPLTPLLFMPLSMRLVPLRI